jgi:hypothetical protein
MLYKQTVITHSISDITIIIFRSPFAFALGTGFFRKSSNIYLNLWEHSIQYALKKTYSKNKNSNRLFYLRPNLASCLPASMNV